MNVKTERIKHAANNEVVRRMLIQYFLNKGHNESFDRTINPVAIQDLPYAVFGLDSKIEIEPHANEIDPTIGKASIGWNMFVLGTQRMYLGETNHDNLLELAKQVKMGEISQDTVLSARHCTTPRRIIMFIERVLADHDSGYIDLTPRTRSPIRSPRSARPAAMASAMSGQFFSRSSMGPQ